MACLHDFDLFSKHQNLLVFDINLSRFIVDNHYTDENMYCTFRGDESDRTDKFIERGHNSNEGSKGLEWH